MVQNPCFKATWSQALNQSRMLDHPSIKHLFMPKDNSTTQQISPHVASQLFHNSNSLWQAGFLHYGVLSCTGKYQFVLYTDKIMWRCKMKFTIYNKILGIWIAELHVIKKYFPEFEPLKLAKNMHAWHYCQFTSAHLSKYCTLTGEPCSKHLTVMRWRIRNEFSLLL